MYTLLSIVTPYFNNWYLTHSRLGELIRHIHEPLEIILVNDASTEADCKSMVGFWQKLDIIHSIKYVENKENLGFGGSHNRGAKVAKGDILVFLSNDVVISGDFVTPIRNSITRYKGNVIVGGRILYDDTGWNTILLGGKPSIVPYPEGWLIAVTPEMWKRIGGWDTKTYGKFDYEDVDLGAWAAYNDVALDGLNLPFLKHLFGQTVSKVHPDRETYTKKNREAFREKWTKKLEEKLL